MILKIYSNRVEVVGSMGLSFESGTRRENTGETREIAPEYVCVLDRIRLFTRPKREYSELALLRSVIQVRVYILVWPI